MKTFLNGVEHLSQTTLLRQTEVKNPIYIMKYFRKIDVVSSTNLKNYSRLQEIKWLYGTRLKTDKLSGVNKVSLF